MATGIDVFPCFVYIIRPAIGNGSFGVVLQSLKLRFEFVCRPQIIGIDEGEIFPRGAGNTSISTRGKTGISIGEDLNARIVKGFDRFYGTIDRTVINNEEFKVGKGLIEDRFQGRSNCLFAIINR